MSFEPNEGQTNSAARFLAHARHSTVYLGPDAATIMMTHAPSAPSRRNPITTIPRKSAPLDSEILKQLRSTALTMKFIGAARRVKQSGEARLFGKTNYFIGKDPRRWRTNIPTFGKVRYASLYPGIDAVFYGNDGTLEYDLVVSPRANPSRIRLALQGAQSVELRPDGDLVASASGDRVVLHKPLIYQPDGNHRTMVQGSFVRLPHGEIGFQLAAYDHNRPLVIDPTITYVTYVSGSSLDLVNWSTIDNAGNQYLTGEACSADFPVHPNSSTGVAEYQSTYGGGCDAFVTVLNPSGTEAIYSTYLGGDQFDEGNSIAVDGSGAVYVAGETGGDFPIEPMNAFQSTDPGLPIEGFVAELSSDGSKLLYSTYLGGSSSAIPGQQDRAFGVAVKPTCMSNCNAYVTGGTPTCDFPTAGTPVQSKNAGYSQSGPGCASSITGNLFDSYVAEVSTDGTSLVYSTYIGGQGGDIGLAIVVDSLGDAFITGLTDGYAGPAFVPTTPATVAQLNFGGTADGFAVKLNPTGSSILYATFLGGSGYDLGQDITLDSSGDAYVSGYTYSIDFPVFAANGYQILESTSPGYLSGWLTKLDPNGSGLLSTYLGNLSSQPSQRVALDSSNNVYFGGWANVATGFPTVSPVQTVPSPSGVLLQSTDNGMTFQNSGFPNSGFPLDVGSMNTHCLAVDSSTSSPGHTVYVGTDDSGLFVSTDDGATFSATSFTAFVGYVYLDTNTTPGTLYFNGLTGSLTAPPYTGGLYSAVGTTITQTNSSNITLLDVDTTVNPSALYGWTATGTIGVSTDGGMTFFTSLSMPSGIEPYSIARDPRSNTLYLGANTGVLTSTDGGSFVQTGMDFSPAYQVIVDYNTNPSTVYAATISQGVIPSTNGFAFPVNIPLGVYTGGVGALDLDRTTNPATLYAGTSSGVFISTDAGNTYESTGLGGANPYITSLAIDPGSPNGIFTGLFLDTVPSVAEISADGSQLLFSSLFGGHEDGYVEGLSVYSNGSSNPSIYLSGLTFAHDFPTTPMNVFQPASSAQISGFAVNISNTTTSAGTNQSTTPIGGTTLTGNVSSGGTTTATTSSTNSNPLPPATMAVSQYVDVVTTATYAGLITVCLNYNPGQVLSGSLSLLHFQENQWANVTTSNNPQTGVICGKVSSLSPFVIAEPEIPDLTITKSHSRNFSPGDTTDSYTISVSNVGNGPTSGKVTVTDSLPPQLIPIAIFGSGWTCTGLSRPDLPGPGLPLSCARSDPLAASKSYPKITLEVSVAWGVLWNGEPRTVINTATVSGGGETNTSNDTARDSTRIVPRPYPY